LCKLKTFELIDNQKVFQGRILGVENNLVSLELTADKKIVNIDFADISRARLIYEPKNK
jgi:ribosome maturation factor RimP